MTECLDCGKAIARNALKCATCRDREGMLMSLGRFTLTRCQRCPRPIWNNKALCGPCAWAKHMAEVKRKRRVETTKESNDAS